MNVKNVAIALSATALFVLNYITTHQLYDIHRTIEPATCENTIYFLFVIFLLLNLPHKS